jgi:hypothetical protein
LIKTRGSTVLHTVQHGKIYSEEKPILQGYFTQSALSIIGATLKR